MVPPFPFPSGEGYSSLPFVLRAASGEKGEEKREGKRWPNLFYKPQKQCLTLPARGKGREKRGGGKNKTGAPPFSPYRNSLPISSISPKRKKKKKSRRSNFYPKIPPLLGGAEKKRAGREKREGEGNFETIHPAGKEHLLPTSAKKRKKRGGGKVLFFFPGGGKGGGGTAGAASSPLIPKTNGFPAVGDTSLSHVQKREGKKKEGEGERGCRSFMLGIFTLLSAMGGREKEEEKKGGSGLVLSYFLGGKKTAFPQIRQGKGGWGHIPLHYSPISFPLIT